MGKVIQFATDTLRALVGGLGNPERDKAAGLYYADPVWDDAQLVNAYRGAWLPRKIIDIPAMDACRAWRDWQAKSAQIGDIEDEEKRLNVRGKVLEAKIKARLFGNKDSGGRVEVLVERVLGEHEALAQVRASKSPKPGVNLLLAGSLEVEVLGREGEFYRLRFPGGASVLELL